MYFIESDIDEILYNRMLHKSFHPNNNIQINELCYLKVLHYNYKMEQTIGELIVNKLISRPTLKVFIDLFESKYPIEKIKLIDDYDGNDYKSMTDNNSSAFNYRCIDGTDILSNHSKGLAIDINPLYNPYIKTVNNQLRILPEEGSCYIDRCVENPYFIKKNDICYNTFIKYGFSWGGDWTECKDYQHFEFIQ